MNNTDMHELVGEITDEQIELMDSVPSYEEIYGKTVATSVIKRLVEGGAISNESRSDIIKNGDNISCKLLLAFLDETDVTQLVATKGKSLKLPQTWSYKDIGNNKVMIEFVVK